MVKLKVKARIIPENVYLNQVEFSSSATPARGERRLQIVVHDPEQWYIGTLANAIKEKFQSLYKCDVGEIKYLKDNDDDCDLDPSEKVSDLLVDEGRALTDQSDQQVIVKVIQEQGRAVREGSVVPDLTPVQYQLPRPPVPRFEQIEPLLGKRKASVVQDVSEAVGDTVENGRKRSRLDQIEETVIPSIERDRAASVVVQDSQPTQSTRRNGHGTRSPELDWSFDRIGPPTIVERENSAAYQNERQQRQNFNRVIDAPTPKANHPKALPPGNENASASKKFIKQSRDAYDLDMDIDDSQMSSGSRSTSRITPRLVRSRDLKRTSNSASALTNGLGKHGDLEDIAGTNQSTSINHVYEAAEPQQSDKPDVEEGRNEVIQADPYSLPPSRQAPTKATGTGNQQEFDRNSVSGQIDHALETISKAAIPASTNKKRKASDTAINKHASALEVNTAETALSAQPQQATATAAIRKRIRKKKPGDGDDATDPKKTVAAEDAPAKPELTKLTTPLKAPQKAARKKRPDSMTLDSPSEQLAQNLQESARKAATSIADSTLQQVETTPSSKAKAKTKSATTTATDAAKPDDPSTKMETISQRNTKSSAIEQSAQALTTKKPKSEPTAKQPEKSNATASSSNVDKSAAATSPINAGAKRPAPAPPKQVVRESSLASSTTSHSVILPPGMSQEEFDRILASYDPTVQPSSKKRSHAATVTAGPTPASLKKTVSRDSEAATAPAAKKSDKTRSVKSSSEAPSSSNVGSTVNGKKEGMNPPPKTPSRKSGNAAATANSEKSGEVTTFAESSDVAGAPEQAQVQLQTPRTTGKGVKSRQQQRASVARDDSVISNESGNGKNPSSAEAAKDDVETVKAANLTAAKNALADPVLQTKTLPTKETMSTPESESGSDAETSSASGSDSESRSASASPPPPSHITSSSKDEENQKPATTLKVMSSPAPQTYNTKTSRPNQQSKQSKPASSIASSSATASNPKPKRTSALPAAVAASPRPKPTPPTNNPKFKLPSQVNTTNTNASASSSRPQSLPVQQPQPSSNPPITNASHAYDSARKMNLTLKDLHRVVASTANSPLTTPTASTPGSVIGGIGGRRGAGGGSMSFLNAAAGGNRGKGILGVDDDDDDDDGGDSESESGSD